MRINSYTRVCVSVAFSLRLLPYASEQAPCYGTPHPCLGNSLWYPCNEKTPSRQNVEELDFEDQVGVRRDNAPGTPSSQPLITWPTPMVNRKGLLREYDESNSWPLDASVPT